MTSESQSESIRRRWPDVVESFPEAAAGYEDMAVYVDRHRTASAPYYAWVASAMRPYLGRRTLELGAGPGFLSRHMRGFDLYMATETWPPFFAELENLCRDTPGMQVLQMAVQDMPARRDDIRQLQLDSIFSTNMLEHIKDDIGALRIMAEPLPAGSRIVHFVPAFRALYGEVDRSIGHYRRYERQELSQKLQAAGLLVERVEFFNFPGFAGWWTTNRLLRRRHTSESEFRLFNALVPVFKIVEKYLPVVAGLSLIGVARVP